MGDYRNLLKIKLCADLLSSGGFHPNIEMREEGLQKNFFGPFPAGGGGGLEEVVP